MEEKLLKSIQINNLIKTGDRVGVAVSGGADSVSLALILHELKEKLGITLHIIHVNHNIRGEESDRDQKFVESLAKKLNVPISVASVDALGYQKQNKLTLEESARVLRYLEFDKIKKQKNLDVVALAHNKSDQVETILLNLFRGCGPHGLVGIERKRGYFIRPLLDITREEIEGYLKNKNQQFVFDSTNDDENYKRNYVRHKIVPTIRLAFPNFESSILNLSNNIKSDESFIESLLPEGTIKNEGKNTSRLDLKVLNQPKSIASRGVRLALQSINASKDVERVHIEAILNLSQSSVGKKLNLPNGIEVFKDYESIIFKRVEPDSMIVNFKESDSFNFGGKEYIISKSNSKSMNSEGLYIDRDKVPSGAIWRKIEAGDKFTKFGGGTKTLNKYLQDKKISLANRKDLLVLADGKDILAVPGVEISESVKIDKSTKRVVKICLK